MAVIPAFSDGWTALRANPVLLLAGFLLAVGAQVGTVGEVLGNPILEATLSLAWLLAFPFVIAGFIGMAREALEDASTSADRFLDTGRTFYVRILLGSALFLAIMIGIMLVTIPVGLALGVGFAALGPGTPATGPGLTAMALFVVGLFALVFGVIMFVQFFDTAIVIEGVGVFAAFGRSVDLVRTNLLSVIAFSVAWFVLLNVILLPDYLRQILATDYGPAAVPTVDPTLAAAILLPVAIAIATVGFAYAYTVYTAYYLRLIAESPPPSTAEPAT